MSRCHDCAAIRLQQQVVLVPFAAMGSDSAGKDDISMKYCRLVEAWY